MSLEDHTCGWIAQLPAPPPPRLLAGRERADCVVVGAGFTGLAAARQLAVHRPDWRIVVVEARRVGSGASARNSGFVVDLGHFVPAVGVDGNRRMVRIARAGLERLRALVRAHDIECAWTEGGRLHGAASDVGLRALERFLRGLDAMGERYDALDAAAMATRTGTSHYRAGAHTRGTATMQPAALVRGIASALPENVEIFEDSAVTRVRGGRPFRLTVVGGGEITGDRLFLATNAYTPALGFLHRRMFPLFTFASLTRVLTRDEQSTLGGTLEWGLVPEEPMGTTVRRTRDQRILIRNTVHYAPSLRVSARVLGAVRTAHRRAFLERFPVLQGVELEYTWGGVMGITLNGAHYFGRLGPNLYAAAGCNGVGVALGTASGTLLADLAVAADSDLLRDILALPGPSWIPPEPFLGVGLRPALGFLRRRARGEL